MARIAEGDLHRRPTEGARHPDLRVVIVEVRAAAAAREHERPVRPRRADRREGGRGECPEGSDHDGADQRPASHAREDTPARSPTEPSGVIWGLEPGW